MTRRNTAFRGKARFGEPKIVNGIDWWDSTQFVRWNHLELPVDRCPRLFARLPARVEARTRVRASAARRSLWKWKQRR